MDCRLGLHTAHDCECSWHDQPAAASLPVLVPIGGKLQSVSIGDLPCNAITASCMSVELTMHDVLLVPGECLNLLSVHRLGDKGVTTMLRREHSFLSFE